MKLWTGFFLCILCSSFTAGAQIFPTSSGSCSVSPSGLVSCEWLSGVPKPGVDGSKSTESAPSATKSLFVTRIALSPSASLPKLACAEDQFIVGLGNGELLNESKAPPLYVSVSEGSVFLMPKEESGMLRNVGKREVDVLVICPRAIRAAKQ